MYINFGRLKIKNAVKTYKLVFDMSFTDPDHLVSKGRWISQKK